MMVIFRIPIILSFIVSIFIFFITKGIEVILNKIILKYIILLFSLLLLISGIGFYAFSFMIKYAECGIFIIWPILIFFIGVDLFLIIFSVMEKLFKKYKYK
ncbi:MAG: hypothetical protein K0R54_1363 [Clostridiaceae bacterium]|jgi:hypothetical protein|nr:hypothetical protein [Clostridiaceae bacterium]